MSLPRQRPRPLIVSHGPRKKFHNYDTQPNVGNLSPDLQPTSPPVFQKPSSSQDVFKIGKYLLVEQNEGNDIYKAVDLSTGEESTCKAFPISKYRDILSAYWQVDSHEHVTAVAEVILGESKAYVFFEKNFGDLHSYVRSKKKLREEEACRLFKQIIQAVQHCHENGIVLRDLKLRKFVFKDEARTQLRLDGLEDAVVLDEDSNDMMTDKHGCPAYVSPEILSAVGSYSGKAADIWSLGVMLYTMLVGRYPFHDSQPIALFGKIRRGLFTIPDNISSRAKCLLKSLLRKEPNERLSVDHVSQHPWLKMSPYSHFHGRSSRQSQDQTVPEISAMDDLDSFYV